VAVRDRAQRVASPPSRDGEQAADSPCRRRPPAVGRSTRGCAPGRPSSHVGGETADGSPSRRSNAGEARRKRQSLARRGCVPTASPCAVHLGQATRHRLPRSAGHGVRRIGRPGASAAGKRCYFSSGPCGNPDGCWRSAEVGPARVRRNARWGHARRGDLLNVGQAPAPWSTGTLRRERTQGGRTSSSALAVDFRQRPRGPAATNPRQ